MYCTAENTKCQSSQFIAKNMPIMGYTCTTLWYIYNIYIYIQFSCWCGVPTWMTKESVSSVCFRPTPINYLGPWNRFCDTLSDPDWSRFCDTLSDPVWSRFWDTLSDPVWSRFWDALSDPVCICLVSSDPSQNTNKWFWKTVFSVQWHNRNFYWHDEANKKKMG
jgi:hypothetical protein